METRLIPLGTNGYIPTFGRHTMAFLVLVEDRAILLDAGSGVARLSEKPIRDLLAPYKSLDLILSHYHLDHIWGLSFLPAFWSSRPVTIYAPGHPFVDCEPGDALEKLLSPPFFPISMSSFPGPVEIVTLKSEEASIDGIPLRLRRQAHVGGSMGVRIGDEIAYVTDTAAQAETVDFAAGISLLLHEVWLTDEEARADSSNLAYHAAASEVAVIAKEAGVGQFMPIHHHPFHDDAIIDGIVECLREGSRVEVTLPEEGRIYRI